MKKQIIVPIIILAILALGGTAYYFYLASRPNPEVPQTVNKIVEVPPTKTPEGFPVNIPIEAGAKIVGSYNATSPTGRVQATRTFESAKSVADNFNFYKTYLSSKGSGWTIINETTNPANPNHKAIFAKNADGILNINISYDQRPGTSIVDLSFVLTKR